MASIGKRHIKKYDYYTHEIMLNVNGKFDVITTHTHMLCDNLVIATGGLAYPSTGSTGDGYKFAKSFNHVVTDLYPALNAFISSRVKR